MSRRCIKHTRDHPARVHAQTDPRTLNTVRDSCEVEVTTDGALLGHQGLGSRVITRAAVALSRCRKPSSTRCTSSSLWSPSGWWRLRGALHSHQAANKW